MSRRYLALVTGGNRGIGLEVCKQLAERDIDIILASRDLKKASEAAAKFTGFPGSVEPAVLDVSSPASIQAFLTQSSSRIIDILVNNAGIYDKHSVSEVGPVDLMESFQNNTVGAFLLCQRLIPKMLRQKYGRVVNVSSTMGSLNEPMSGSPAYRMSKTALNAVTRIFAAETMSTNVLVNSVCPGWVRTDMGGAGASRSVEKGAETIVYAATLPEKGPHGLFLRDKEPIAW